MPKNSREIELKSKDDLFNQLMAQLDDIENQAKAMGATQMVGKVADARDITNSVAKEVINEIKKEKKKYSKERKELAKKVSEMARTANKRLDRLEKNHLEGQSAYKAWYDDGGIRFSVKGKNYQQLQKEYWRVQKFLDAQTSTIRGAKENMERVAKEVMKLDKETVASMSLEDLNNATSNFFKIKEAMEKHYEEINDNARRIDYQKMFAEISEYYKNSISELSELGNEADFDAIANNIMEYIKSEQALEQQIDLWE